MMCPSLWALFALGFLSIVSLWTPAAAQTRQLKICVPDYSVGVMPFFIAKQNGYFAQEQMDVEVIAGRGNLCTMGLIAGSFQFTYSPSTFDAVVAGDIKGKVIYVAEKFLLHRFIVAPQIKRFEDLKGKKIAISAFGTLTDMLTREILIDRGLKPMQDVMLLQTGGVRSEIRGFAVEQRARSALALPASFGGDAGGFSQSGVRSSSLFVSSVDRQK